MREMDPAALFHAWCLALDWPDAEGRTSALARVAWNLSERVYGLHAAMTHAKYIAWARAFARIGLEEQTARHRQCIEDALRRLIRAGKAELHHGADARESASRDPDTRLSRAAVGRPCDRPAAWPSSADVESGPARGKMRRRQWSTLRIDPLPERRPVPRGVHRASTVPPQVEGVAFLLRRRRAILADDMGLGKTRQAIIAMRHAAPVGPYLVVCPASVKRNWPARSRRCCQAHPSASGRRSPQSLSRAMECPVQPPSTAAEPADPFAGQCSARPVGWRRPSSQPAAAPRLGRRQLRRSRPPCQIR